MRFGLGMPTSVEQRQRLVAGLRLGHARGRRAWARTSWLADRERRVQVAHRLLRDVGDPLAAQWCQPSGQDLVVARRHGVLAVELDGAGRRSALSGSSPRIANAVWDLPDPDSPTMPRTSPRSTWKLTSSTTFLTGAVSLRVADRQVGDLEQVVLGPRRAPAPARRCARAVVCSTPVLFSLTFTGPRVRRAWRCPAGPAHRWSARSRARARTGRVGRGRRSGSRR